MIPPVFAEASAYAPDRGILESSIPCDISGSGGVNGIQFGIQFADYMLLGGLPVDMSGNSGAFYLSHIHSGVGSDTMTTGGAETAPPVPTRPVNRPAFSGPEVTGYFGSGPDVNNEKLNGFRNTEKRLRTNSDSPNPSYNGTIWVPTRGKSRLAFSLWVRSSDPASLLTFEAYRDLHTQDKVPGVFNSGLAMPRNALLVYQYGPFLPVAPAGGGTTDNRPNASTGLPIDMPAGCNLYFLLRSNAPAAINDVVGSVRLV
jgi:hypothetical protein